MGEILSHAEVEAILSAIEPSRREAKLVTTVSAVDSADWKRHDFRCDAVLRGPALNIVHALHGGICQRWQERMVGLLQEPVNVRPVGACQSTGAEFLASIASRHHVMCHVGHAGSPVESLLIWSADLVQSLISKMLGGTCHPGSDSTAHSLTNIELRLLSRLSDVVLGELASLLADRLHVVAVSQDPASLSDRAGKFPTIWFSFEIDGCGTGGLIHLGIPRMTLNPADTPGDDHVPGAPDAIPAGIQQISVQVSASLASLRIRTSDLAALQVGDIVMTDLTPRETISLQLDGVNLCPATIGTHHGRKALRLTGSPQHGGN